MNKKLLLFPCPLALTGCAHPGTPTLTMPPSPAVATGPAPPAPITLALLPPPILTKSQQQQAQAASAIEANRESSQRADLQQRANPNYWRYQQEENEAQQKQAIQNRQESITAQRQQNAYINAAARNAVLANQRQGN